MKVPKVTRYPLAQIKINRIHGTLKKRVEWIYNQIGRVKGFISYPTGGIGCSFTSLRSVPIE